MEIKIPYGKTFQTLSIEEGFELLESKIQELEAGADGGAIVRAAMDSPIGSPKLRELAAGKKNAVLIISDHTRPVASKDIVPFMLEELRAAGVSCGRVWREPPTRNDVFLELCGRELRD